MEAFPRVPMTLRIYGQLGEARPSNNMDDLVKQVCVFDMCTGSITACIKLITNCWLRDKIS